MSEVATHYKLLCYVCGPACQKPSPFEGWATFTQIFTYRPDNCRFAVAQRLMLRDVGTHLEHEPEGGMFICWDLLNDMLVQGRYHRDVDGFIQAPEPIWTSPQPEALIMKAMALYERA